MRPTPSSLQLWNVTTRTLLNKYRFSMKNIQRLSLEKDIFSHFVHYKTHWWVSISTIYEEFVWRCSFDVLYLPVQLMQQVVRLHFDATVVSFCVSGPVTIGSRQSIMLHALSNNYINICFKTWERKRNISTYYVVFKTAHFVEHGSTNIVNILKTFSLVQCFVLENWY